MRVQHADTVRQLRALADSIEHARSPMNITYSYKEEHPAGGGYIYLIEVEIESPEAVL